MASMKASPKSRKLNVLSEESKKIIDDAFSVFDCNEDGFVDYYELKAAIRALGFPIRKEGVKKILEAYDKPNGRKISRRDFNDVLADMTAQRDPVDEMKYAYRLFLDESSDGIAVPQLRKAAQAINENLTEEEMHGMILEFDHDRDEKINEQEFLAIMLDAD
ncbi:centrin-3-like isoform X2 [Ischnura elegans]|uniref:centrin-3-like isoform X2 n=1 Tax=Ischnura elegans TaxID=197161 RepID=UPI001ED8890A|nr:centrin-3-like isoform X2 [Ischnura elegans]